MPDKKLTDSEIVKALEDWIKNYDGSYVNFKTLGNALDLINRLQAENEKLQKFKAYFDFYYGCDIEILGIDENGDTTSFDEFYNCAIANAESIEHHIAHIIKTAKAEAVKEFADKLKLHAYHECDITGYRYLVVQIEEIDNLLKELVGDK